MAASVILERGMKVPAAHVYDIGGSSIDLASFWKAQPTLIFFLRHAGCALCRAHLHAIRYAYAEFQRRGAAVLAITFADSQGAAQLKQSQRLPFPIVADPSSRRT